MIIFLDLDDTLWKMHQIPYSAKQAIQRAHEHGHKIFINTGRTRSEVPHHILEELPLSGFCFGAGSEILINKKQVFYQPLNKKDTKDLAKKLEPMDLGVSLEGSEATFQNPKNYEMFQRFAQMDRTGSGRIQHYKIEQMTEKDYDQIMKISVIQGEQFDPTPINALLHDELVFTPFSNTGGEITNKNLNKATAIRFVKEYYKTNEQTMAIGDSENDITMLKEADISIAMGNGQESVKTIAKYITTNIEDNGIYNAFKNFDLI